MRVVKIATVVVSILICCWLIRTTYAFGMSRALVKYALVARSVDIARQATDFTPNDATAYQAVAAVSGVSGNPRDAIAALERAIALRPADYTLWVALAVRRDQVGDSAGALQACEEAVKLAPAYANPRWRRGNLLLRMGQSEAAFRDLNQAASMNPAFLPRLVDLAWGISGGDPARVEQLVPLQSSEARLALSKILAREGRAEDAVKQFRLAGAGNGESQSQMVQQLLSTGDYKAAYDIWKAEHKVDNALVVDGGFESSLAIAEEAFGWRVPAHPAGVKLSLDSTEQDSGKQSLFIEFQGDPNPSSNYLSQLLIVEPSTRYRLLFAARTKEIVSGGPPVISVTEPAGQNLAQSEPLTKDTANWKRLGVEFTTGPNAQAVMIKLTRNACTTSPCPIFGSLSLDSFSLERLN